MKEHEPGQIARLCLRYVAAASAAVSIVTAIFLISNHQRIKMSDPAEMAILAEMREKAIANPLENGNAEKFRELDLLARKNYIHEILSAKRGGYLLLLSASLLMLSLAAGELLREKKPVPRAGKNAPSPDRRLTRTALWISSSALILFSVAIAKKYGGENIRPSPSAENRTAKDRLPGLAVQVDSPRADEHLANWPAFRGPLSTALSQSAAPPKSWNGKTGENIVWKKEVPLPGKSSPVIWGGKLFLTGADAVSRKLFCFSAATGEILWTQDVGTAGAPPKPLEILDDTGFAAPTAATDGRYVCAIFANGDLSCVDFEGAPLWTKNLGTPENPYGYASSPVILGSAVIVQFDNSNLHFASAYSLADGREIWRKERDVVPCWSSPTAVATKTGTSEASLLVLSGNPFSACYDPADGRELWRNPCKFNDLSISPAYSGDTVIVPSEYDEFAAFSASKGNLIWRANGIPHDIPTPLVTGEIALFASSSGTVSCHSMSDGRKLWEHIFETGFYSSPVAAGGTAYLIDRKGITRIFELKDEFSPLPDAELGEDCDTTPAIHGKSIYIRGVKNLYRIGQD